MIYTILSYDLKGLNAMNNSRIGMIWIIFGRELKALDAINSLGL